MKREIETKFYHFAQNNSGGYFIEEIEHGICEDVIIEARNYDEAWLILENKERDVGNLFDFCPCCGERWNAYGDDSDGTEKPEIYGSSVFELKKEMFREQCCITYYDGKIEHIKFQ